MGIEPEALASLSPGQNNRATEHVITGLRISVIPLLGTHGWSGCWGTRITGRVRHDLRNTNQKQKRYFPVKELQDLDQTLEECGIRYGVLGHFHRSGKEGRLTILNRFSAPDYEIGIYESGKGIRSCPLNGIREGK